MHITAFEIEDIRCFRGLHRVELPKNGGSHAGWIVFAGRNGAGKTTLLRALVMTAMNRVQTAHLLFRTPGSTSVGASSGRVSLTLDDESATTVSITTYPGPGQFWTTGGMDLSHHLDAPNPVIAAYGPYRQIESVGDQLDRFRRDPAIARIMTLFHDGASLSDAVTWLQHLHLRALEGKPGAARLRDSVLAVLGDGLLPDGSEVLRVDSDGLWIRRDGVELPLAQISDGYRTVAALVADLLRHLAATFGDLEVFKAPDGCMICPLPGVVLIDEVDAHLHVAWQQRIGVWLTKHFPNLQFLVTTHSPFICQAASPGGLFRLPGPGEERRIQALSESAWRTVVHGGADEAVMTELFGLEHAHSDAAERLRDELAALEARVLRGKASPRDIARYEKLRSELNEDLGELADRKLRALGMELG